MITRFKTGKWYRVIEPMPLGVAAPEMMNDGVPRKCTKSFKYEADAAVFQGITEGKWWYNLSVMEEVPGPSLLERLRMLWGKRKA